MKIRKHAPLDIDFHAKIKKCIFLWSKTCEFLHEERFPEENREVTQIEASVAAINTSFMSIDEKMGTLDTVIKQTQERITAIEKVVSKNTQIESKVILLEKENTELKYQLNSMVLNVSKEFKDLEQKLEQVFKTIGNGSILQKDELHNTEKNVGR